MRLHLGREFAAGFVDSSRGLARFAGGAVVIGGAALAYVTAQDVARTELLKRDRRRHAQRSPGHHSTWFPGARHCVKTTFTGSALYRCVDCQGTFDTWPGDHLACPGPPAP